MSSSDSQRTGGASIKPSARRSIHSHNYCPFAYTEIMGRYGMAHNKREETTQSSDQRANKSNDHGTDEVDNAFSKMSHPISSSSFTNQYQPRRNSLKIYEHQTENNSDTLSKSLPATLPSHSYCSDDSDDELPVRQEHVYSDTSYDSACYGTPGDIRNSPLVRSQVTSPAVNRRTPNNTPVSVGFNRSGSISTHSANSTRIVPESQGSSRIVMPLILLVGVLIAILSMVNTRNVSNGVIYDESRFYSDIDLLGNKYRIDENAVLRMQTGIATIFKRQDAGSFMFVYNSNDHMYNPEEFDAFVNEVSVTASKYLRNDSTPVHYTMVEGSSLEMNGHGELINRFRDELDRTGVMLVKHIEAIPSALAMAFHYYCDEYNPLVKKSAIFFTLNLAKCSENGDKKSTHATIEKCLIQKWHSVPADSIGPLLTRVVSVVIDVTSAV